MVLQGRREIFTDETKITLNVNELVTEDDWAKFEEFCSKISNRDNIYYCTNKEAILNYTN